MSTVYSTYEAKTRFSEILRKVRAGQRVVVSYHGKPVAEIRPVEEEQTFEQRLERLAAEGLLAVPQHPPEAQMRPLTRRRGALQRFLDTRD
jgi:prevent-host-death family protein